MPGPSSAGPLYFYLHCGQTVILPLETISSLAQTGAVDKSGGGERHKNSGRGEEENVRIPKKKTDFQKNHRS